MSRPRVINSNLILTNVGNVYYNDTLLVQIGEESVGIPLSLGVGETEKYLISAPDGNYEVSVLGMKRNVPLSGNAIQVQKIGSNYNFSLILWIIVLLILVFGAYIIFRRGRKKRVFAKAKSSRKVISLNANPSVKEASFKESSLKESKDSIFIPPKKVELSLSITGSKQSATIGCLFLKNYEEISSGKGGVKETLDKVFKFIEDNKGFIYSNKSYVFFILAPSFTKTFKNQKEGVLISQKVKEILKDHNKRFKQKIDYGISLNYGEIITKIEKGGIKFMSLGTFMTSSKKLSAYSEGDVLISEEMKAGLGGDVKAELVLNGSLKAYKIGNIVDRNSHSTFISGFLARQERDRAKEKELTDKSE